jgi:hypothetical protein
MPPKFVSRGVVLGDEVIEKPSAPTVEEAEPAPPTEPEPAPTQAAEPADVPKPSSWSIARKELEDDRSRRAEQAAVPTDDRTLFAILQENKGEDSHQSLPGEGAFPLTASQ